MADGDTQPDPPTPPADSGRGSGSDPDATPPDAGVTNTPGPPAPRPGPAGHAPPQSPPAFFPPPGHPPPGYAPPGLPPSAYPPPGYAPPGYAPPGYAPPGFAPPGYAPPGFAPPGYGFPGFVPPGFPPPGYGHPPWGFAPPVPGSGRFRAQSIGELLDSAFTVYRRRFLTIIAVTALIQLPYVVIQILLIRTFSSSVLTTAIGPGGTGFSSTPEQTQEAINLLLVSLGILGVSLFYAVVMQTIVQAATVRIVSDDYLDRPTGFGDALRHALRRFGGLLAFGMLNLLILAAPGVVGFLILLALAGNAPALLILFVILWFLFFVFISIRLQLSVPALILEAVPATRGIARSWRLTRGSFWRLLGLNVIVNIVTYVLSLILQTLIGAVFSGIDPINKLLVNSAASSAIGILTSPLLLIVLTLAYYDVRIRKEAFDLEMLASSL